MAINGLYTQIQSSFGNLSSKFSKYIKQQNPVQSAINDAIDTIFGTTAEGIEGFQFSVLENFDISYITEITDHPLQDGSVINQGRSHKPTIVKMTGIISEIYTKKSRAIEALNFVNNKVGAINRYLPTEDLTAGAVQQFNEITSTATSYINYADNLVQDGKSFISLFTDALNPETKQEEAHRFLESLRKGRKLINLNSVYKHTNLTNLLITNIDFRKETKRSNHDVQITITFKQITPFTLATTSLTDAEKKRIQGGLLAKKSQEKVVKTKAQEPEQNQSLLFRTFTGG